MPSLPCQIICEGDGDGGFLKELARAHDLPAFEVIQFSQEKGGLEGAFAGLEVFALDRGFVKRVLIVCDNDDDPDEKFKSIQRIVDRAKRYPVPKAPAHIRPSENVRVAVVMVPGTGETGNLETLFLKNVAAGHPELLECAKAFDNCKRNGAADDWRRGDRDKMLLRSIIASCIKDDPNCSLNWIWGKEGCPMNVKGEEFKWIADFIREFFSGPF